MQRKILPWSRFGGRLFAIKKRPKAYFYCCFALSLIGKTIAAINRTVISGLEGHLAAASARSANRVKHLARTSVEAIVLPCVAAGLTSLRLIGEASFFEEILFAGRENELLIAISADDGFVLMHQIGIPLLIDFTSHTFHTYAKHYCHHTHIAQKCQRIYCATHGLASMFQGAYGATTSKSSVPRSMPLIINAIEWRPG